MTKIISDIKFIPRPPIVTILGHVDHGKTTLLDSIRKTDVAVKEHGGITQHIGAYQISISSPSPKNKNIQKITFIDTPGHEAFAKMRARGADICDIAILVVAGNDGVMPQTLESINCIKKAKIPLIIAVNKIDLPDISLDKIKKQLSKTGLTLEEYGGETPLIALSAKTGLGIDKLLNTILLLSDLYQIHDATPDILNGVVIESKLSKNKGPIATLIIKSGNLKIGDDVICENQSFRIRALFDWNEASIEKAKPSDPVEVMGWKKLPLVGSILKQKNQSEQIQPSKINSNTGQQKALTNTDNAVEEEKIKLIIKADTAGSLEAIMSGLKNDIQIISATVGNISESDILLAKTTKSIVIGFHLNISENIFKLARSEKVLIKTFKIIYELFDEVGEVVKALKQGNLVTVLGEAKVTTVFPIKKDLIAGIKVISGRIARGDQIKVMRGSQEICRARIKSLRHHKEDITKAEQGMEAGVFLSQKVEFLTDDSIISIG